MENPIRRIKSMYRKYDTDTGAEILALGGGIIGSVAGVVLPAYIGWEIGDYIQEAIKFGPIIGTATKTVGAVGLTSMLGGITIPVGFVCGIVTGGTIGAVTGAAKEKLEDLISKK